jgi:hypothetical protein
LTRRNLVVSLILGCTFVLGATQVFAGNVPFGETTVTTVVTGLQSASGSGSTIGPGGALYFTESAAGRISRFDLRTSDVATFTSGLPISSVGVGGAMDVAFVGETAYALVCLVGPDVGGSDTVGIYRVDGPGSFTVIADIGEFNVNNPPETDFFIPTGVPYAMEALRDGFLVTDGHFNRILWVALDGEISVLAAFDNVVPTGLAVWGNTVYTAEAGPLPHLPEDGRIVAFVFGSPTATEVASGARLAVDVEFGLGRTLYALSQGMYESGPAGSPAAPDTGALLQVNGDGTMTVVAEGLDRPTSVEFIGNTAYVVGLGGEIYRIDRVSTPPYGVRR